MDMMKKGPQNTGADRPLRISGEPVKVQVSDLTLIIHFCSVVLWFYVSMCFILVEIVFLCLPIPYPWTKSGNTAVINMTRYN